MSSEKLTPTKIAIEALKKIEKHEKDCGERWAEATTELKHIKEIVNKHGQRWERMAWFLISGIGSGILFIVMRALI